MHRCSGRATGAALPADRVEIFTGNLAAWEATGQPLASWTGYTLQTGETLAQVARRVAYLPPPSRRLSRIAAPIGGFLMGRQYTPAFEALATFDIMGTQSSLSAGQIITIPAGVDIRYNNALQYRVVQGPWSGSLMASFTGGAPAAAPAHTQFAGLEIPPRTYGTPTPPAASDDDAEAEEDEEEIDEDIEDEEDDEPAPPPVSRSRKTRTQPVPAQPAAPAGGVIDPMQWWGALSQQFQHIATNAMKDVAKQTALDTTRQVASGLTEQAVKTATGAAGKVTRGLTETVARNMGTAAGMGKAAARAVSGRQAPARPAAKKAAPKPAAKKAPARVRAAQPAPTAAPRARIDT